MTVAAALSAPLGDDLEEQFGGGLGHRARNRVDGSRDREEGGEMALAGAGIEDRRHLP